MADRLLALVGRGKGPLLRTAGMRKPKLKVSGLCHDERVSVETDSGTIEVSESGTHQLVETSWVQLVSIGTCKTLICTVHEGA